MASLHAQHLAKSYKKRKVVLDVSLTVSSGQIVGLLGPNGAGKTTTIKMVTGLLAPTSGTISILGHDVVKDPVKAKQKLGYIPDDPFVYEYLTGREFLRLTGDL